MSIFLNPGGSFNITSTGEIVLVPNDITNLRQQILNAFNTTRGSHPLFPDYGFDYIKLMQDIHTPKELLIFSLVLETLNPDKIDGMFELTQVKISIEGTIAYVEIKAKTTKYNTLTEVIQVNYIE